MLAALNPHPSPSVCRVDVSFAPVQARAAKPEVAQPSDAALVSAARDGEPWAQEALFRRYAGLVNGLAFRLLGHADDVDDVVQEAFAQALVSLHRLKSEDQFQSWLSAIVVRVAYKVIRRRRLLTRLGFRPELEVDFDALIAPGAPPDVAAELRAVYAEVQSFPTKLRVPFLLRKIEELTIEEVAELSGASVASVKRYVAAAEQLLAKRLKTGKGGGP